MTLQCPNCDRPIQIRLSSDDESRSSYYFVATYPCGGCGKGLSLYAEKTAPNSVYYFLVDPTQEWSLEEILRREG